MDAERAFEKALDILDSEFLGRLGNGASEPGQYLRLQQVRARAWNNLGVMRNETGRFADAEKAFREALVIKERPAERFPSVPEYRRDLASSLNNLGIALTFAKRADEADSAYQKAIQLLQRLVIDYPGGALYAVELAGTYSNMGRWIGDQGKLEESLPWLAKSIDSLEEALRRDERVAKVRESLCVARWTRAMTLGELERFSDAMTDWDRAVAMDDGRYRLQLWLKRASNLLHLKDLDRATADAERAAESSDATAENLYDAACVYAVSARLAEGDRARVDSCAARALELLRQAAVKGFKDLAHMKTDPDLDTLRSREDFRLFIEELEAKSGAPSGQERK
jgi:tetratricopeptide (TPR) repeat protein